MAPKVELDYELLIACIILAIATVFYLFFWNRLLAFLISTVLRVWGWQGGTARIWIEFGALDPSVTICV